MIKASQSRWLSNEKIRSPNTADKSLYPKLKWYSSGIRVKFKGSYLKQNKPNCTSGHMINLFIVYELDAWSQGLNTVFTLKDCLFAAVKLTKNADPNKYSYSEYGIGFDSHPLFSI